ncbi:holo-ACP synthase [Thermobrachium celere]|uniref:Holo-[acyl-carrier-protein] synthase n=1 Tax=Thermobrachium celere DSM 8682 TaxID=941824 RepID=R7RQR6_9CLOT|nr:holo-ACP synthase [Thermobrachium celere]GFR35660.1 holo-[acyl-carrier-protein] synthase [Thermobrachium celere]CDF57696.1 Holo-[acyl-carrier protein] synthase [Thermobrachium celere DSM 8682]
MVKGVGTDIIEISRIKRAIEKTNFINRVFTENEIEYLKNKNVESAAGYFAAKEAVSKALGTGIKGFSFKDIEILKRDGAPYVVLHRGAKKIAEEKEIKNIQISISHCREYAVAFVVMEG